MTLSVSLASALAFLLLALGAPLIPGIANRTKAIFAGRRGLPVWQLYADLWKLARRGVVYSRTTTVAFRLAPVALVATTLAASALFPLDGRAGLMGFAGDAIAFAYLLALGRFTLILAALDTGSSFEGMGASREATFATLSELGFFVALAALGLSAHAFSLGAMFGASVASGGGLHTIPAAVLLGVALFGIALAECARVPVDDPATHLELTMVHEVMVLDHSGPDLALILYASALKHGVFAAIVLGALLPGRPSGITGVATLFVAFVVFGVAVGAVESAMARLRLSKVPLYLATAAALALFALILHVR